VNSPGKIISLFDDLWVVGAPRIRSLQSFMGGTVPFELGSDKIVDSV